jgi:hypothetical protein
MRLSPAGVFFIICGKLQFESCNSAWLGKVLDREVAGDPTHSHAITSKDDADSPPAVGIVKEE